MKIFLKISSIVLLLFNGFGALYGGLSLITDPTGGKLKLPLSYLETTPFNNYLIPGIVLLCVNGIFPFIVLALILFRHQRAPFFILAQGVLLSGWIVVQIFLLQMFYAPLHGTLLAVGAALTICGYYLSKYKMS